jgi:CheY-like chemotaxis protein
MVRIMVVDDDEGHIELVRRNLRRAGINNEIVAFRSGNERWTMSFAGEPI